MKVDILLNNEETCMEKLKQEKVKKKKLGCLILEIKENWQKNPLLLVKLDKDMKWIVECC